MPKAKGSYKLIIAKGNESSMGGFKAKAGRGQSRLEIPWPCRMLQMEGHRSIIGCEVAYTIKKKSTPRPNVAVSIEIPW